MRWMTCLTSPAPIPPAPNASPSVSTQTQKPVIGRASTVLFVAKSTSSFPSASRSSALGILNETFSQPLPNVPPGVPFSDLTVPGTIVVLSQPRGQKCAVVGGIMAARMAKLGAQGVVVDGRVRDLSSLRELDMPVNRSIQYFLGSRLVC